MSANAYFAVLHSLSPLDPMSVAARTGGPGRCCRPRSRFQDWTRRPGRVGRASVKNRRERPLSRKFLRLSALLVAFLDSTVRIAFSSDLTRAIYAPKAIWELIDCARLTAKHLSSCRSPPAQSRQAAAC